MKMNRASSTNYGFRGYLTGVTALCTGGPSWTDLLETDSNYKVYVAAALAAKAQGSAVTVYSCEGEVFSRSSVTGFAGRSCFL